MKKEILFGLVGISLIVGAAILNRPKAACEDYHPEIETYTEHIVIQEYVEEPLVKKSYKAYSFIPMDERLQTELMRFCDEKEIAYDLIFAMIKTESEFQWVIGDDGQAVGYMQIWPLWWNDLLSANGINPYTDIGNLKAGVVILDHLLKKTGGDLRASLIAYNGGQDYPQKVYSNMNWIEEQKGAM